MMQTHHKILKQTKFKKIYFDYIDQKVHQRDDLRYSFFP